MNVNLYNTTDYEEKSNWTLGENKPNSKPMSKQLVGARPKWPESAKMARKIDIFKLSALRAEIKNGTHEKLNFL